MPPDADQEEHRDLDQEGPTLDPAELLERQPERRRVARLAGLRGEEYDEAQRHFAYCRYCRVCKL